MRVLRIQLALHGMHIIGSVGQSLSLSLEVASCISPPPWSTVTTKRNASGDILIPTQKRRQTDFLHNNDINFSVFDSSEELHNISLRRTPAHAQTNNTLPRHLIYQVSNTSRRT